MNIVASFFSPRFAGVTGLLSATLLLGGLVTRRIPEPLAAPLTTIPAHIQGWQANEEVKLEAGPLRALDPTSYLARNYQKNGSQLSLFIAFFAQQRAGESMHSPKHCLPGAGWEIWNQDSAHLSVSGRNIEINKYSIEHMGNRMLMFYWYQSRNRIIANEYVGKISLARDTIFTGHTAGSIVRIILPDRPGASEEGIEFATKLIPEVQRCFGGEANLRMN